MAAQRKPVEDERCPKLFPIKVGSYDPAAKVPVLFGDPDGDVLVAEGDLVLLAGEVGAGKSVTMADAALAAAFGQPLFDFPCPKVRKVMLVLADGDGEMPTRRRLYRLAKGRNLSGAGVDECKRFVLFVPCGFSLDDEGDFAELNAEIGRFNPDVICIETLASLMGPDRDPYNQADAADFMNKRLRPLQEWMRPEARRTLLVGAHLTKMRPGKAGKRIKDRVATSYYTLGAADAAIGLDAVAEERFVVRMAKRSRWGCAYSPFLVIIKPETKDNGDKHGPLTLFKAGTVRDGDEQKARSRPGMDAALKVITEARAKVPDLDRTAAVKLCVAAKLPRSNAYRACDEMGIA